MPLYKNIEQQAPGKEYCVKNTKQKRCRYFALLGGHGYRRFKRLDGRLGFANRR